MQENRESLLESSLYSPEGLKKLNSVSEHHSVGPIKLLPVNTKKYPQQVAHIVLGNPLSVEVVTNIATEIDETFPEALGELRAEREQRIIAKAGGYMEDGMNLIAVFNHESILDIGEAHFALKAILAQKGRKFETGMIAGRSMTMLGYQSNKHDVNGETEPVIATNMLGLYSDKIFLTMPVTERMKKAFGNDPKMIAGIKIQNELAMEEMDFWLQRGGRFLGIAASGTTDKQKSGIVMLGRASDGTADILARDDVVVLAVATYRDKAGRLHLLLVSEPFNITRPEQTHSVIMSGITKVLRKKTSRDYRYEGEDSFDSMDSLV